MAAYTWQLDALISLARYDNDQEELARLDCQLVTARSLCVHVESPEVPGRCYKCGDESWLGPAIHKVCVPVYRLPSLKVGRGT